MRFPRTALPAAAGVFALLCFATSARAQIITNGGFEAPGYTAPPYYRYISTNSGTNPEDNVPLNFITGWTFSGSVNHTEWSYLMKRGVAGGYDAHIGAGDYGINFHSGQVATTNFSVTSGETYTVSFLAKTSDAGSVRVTAAGNVANFSPTTTFATYSFDFTAGSTGSVSLVFEMPSQTQKSFYLDSVSVTAIPEPSTYAMLAGVGVLGLAAWRRRAAARS